MHIKHRPTGFEDVIGNNVIIKSIKSQLKTIPVRPFLFIGSYGSGKSTLAGIVAKEFGAEEQNIIERNCVQFSKVEQMREFLDEYNKPSLLEEKRVIIFDEIHELSDKAINALLLPLEVKNLKNNILYIGCTNKFEKIKDNKAFISRFKKYNVSVLSIDESLVLLNKIANLENIKIPKWLKSIIVSKAEGVPRNILNFLALVKEGVSSEEEAFQLLDIASVEDKEIFDLFKILLNSKKFKFQDIINVLNTILKNNNPNNIKHVLMNLISNKVIYPQTSYNERKILYNIYKEFNIINSNLDKADLIMLLNYFYESIKENL